MDRLDIACCLLAGLFGATTYPLVVGVRDVWTFVRSTAVGTFASACTSHLAVLLLDNSEYLPGIHWGTLWPCVAVAFLDGLMANLVCRSLLEGYDNRTGFIGKAFDYVLGKRPEPDLTKRAHRPDSDPSRVG